MVLPLGPTGWRFLVTRDPCGRVLVEEVLLTGDSTGSKGQAMAPTAKKLQRPGGGCTAPRGAVQGLLEIKDTHRP